MNFSIVTSLQILESTPDVLIAMLQNLSPDWTSTNEGENTWSVFDVVGHLIHGEKTDWVPRAKLILSDQQDKTFEPFDRFAQFENSTGKTMSELLEEFKQLRSANLEWLRSAKIRNEDLEREGIHPAFGQVSLRQLLATWTVHDLNHIAQIARIMAKQYQSEVGPWSQYLGILHRG